MSFRRIAAAVMLLLPAAPLSAGASAGIRRGPLQITADETVSKERGKLIEAAGRVNVRYDLESGDQIESFSSFARYDEDQFSGELLGGPTAVWRSRRPEQPPTTLQAERIFLKIRESELQARGNVTLFQGSSTLKAQELVYSNLERRIHAQGGRPAFSIRQEGHDTEISAEEITGRMDKKEMTFDRSVKGTVRLRSSPPAP